ncbi:aspartate aminotransferase family protein [Candidatus Amarolinea dominans]|uniref:pyridoxal phosphate-dependent decarboxylase family protein n=1 Tax=Candidatus Amarolinea dominans TaxID=3140696 RepID=UPI001DEF1DB3|nr:aspartate aminotransferase family protein [Anaerolineae bacterium]
MSESAHLPTHGNTKEAILARMASLRDHDVNWRAGRAWSLVFDAGDEVSELLQAAYTMFFAENGLNPTAFPSLRRFETDVVAMTGHLLGAANAGDDIVGNMTSGGTESLLLAVKTARDWARSRRPAIRTPEMVLPITAHPALAKAAHYFGVTAVYVPVRADFRADVAAMTAAITPNTILLVGSAPSYPQGVVDPIRELGQVALARGLLLHVDACVGGMMLPFARRLGYAVPPFDLSVPGVTSLSVDLHKYGYAAKGASVILYRGADLRRFQFFVQTAWPGGIYPSPTMTGTRPGGAIAAAWAVMNYLGEAGYVNLAAQVMAAARKLKQGINATPGLHVLGSPDMSVLAIGSTRLDIYDVGDELTLAGWHLDRQQSPPSLHMTVNMAHVAVTDSFLADLAHAVQQVSQPDARRRLAAGGLRVAQKIVHALPPRLVTRLTSVASRTLGQGSGLSGRTAPMYGLIGSLPSQDNVDDLVLDLLDQLTRPTLES